MSDRERAKKIVSEHRLQYGIGGRTDILIDTITSALAQARAEGLRQAAEVARGFWRIGKPEGVSFYDAIADEILSLIPPRALAEGGE